jgi:hypothetical protein
MTSAARSFFFWSWTDICLFLQKYRLKKKKKAQARGETVSPNDSPRNMKYSTSDSSDSDLEDAAESNGDFFDMEMDESASVSDGTSNCSDVIGSDSSTVVGSNNGYFVALIPTVVNPPNDQGAPNLSYHHNVAIPRLNLNFGNYFHEVESAPSTFNGTRSADATTHAGHYSLPTTPHGQNSHHVQLAASLPTYTVFSHHGGNVSLPMTPHEQPTRKSYIAKCINLISVN